MPRNGEFRLSRGLKLGWSRAGEKRVRDCLALVGFEENRGQAALKTYDEH